MELTGDMIPWRYGSDEIENEAKADEYRWFDEWYNGLTEDEQEAYREGELEYEM